MNGKRKLFWSSTVSRSDRFFQNSEADTKIFIIYLNSFANIDKKIANYLGYQLELTVMPCSECRCVCKQFVVPASPRNCFWLFYVLFYPSWRNRVSFFFPFRFPKENYLDRHSKQDR